MSEATVFSPCRNYRYTLWREWDVDPNIQAPPFVAFIGLNPSTADEVQDDPTIRRCIGYSKRWGFSRFCMLNVFAFRATDPKEMKRALEPVGTDNDFHIQRIVKSADLVVCAWGNGGDYLHRGRRVLVMLREADVQPHALGLTTNGVPKHPLYLHSSLCAIPISEIKH